MTIAPPDNSQPKPDRSAVACRYGVAAADCRADGDAAGLCRRARSAHRRGLLLDLVEGERAAFLDHPPGIAWLIRFGTAIFGDTRLGVRFGGIVAMLVTQLLLADIVRRVTHDARAVILAVLLPEAALYYGLLMAKVAPDTAMIPCAVAMLWSLVRLHESGNPRWWLAAGLFAGLGAAVEIHRDHAAAGGRGVRAGAGLAAALAAQPLAVAGGADCGRSCFCRC